MKFWDILILGVLGFLVMLVLNGQGAHVNINPFEAGAGNGASAASGSSGWLGGNNISGGDSVIPWNIG